MGLLSDLHSRYLGFLNTLTDADRVQFYVTAFAVAVTNQFCPVRETPDVKSPCGRCHLSYSCAFAHTLLHHVEKILKIDPAALDEMIGACLDDVRDFETLLEALR